MIERVVAFDTCTVNMEKLEAAKIKINTIKAKTCFEPLMIIDGVKKYQNAISLDNEEFEGDMG